MTTIIGKVAPAFACEAAVDNQIKKIALHEINGYKLLFFYPLNFTFVCPTELHALQDSITDFQKRSVSVLALSVDSVHSHLAWLNTAKEQGGINGISYPLLSDINKTIARDYGVLNEEAGVALRGVFLIDSNNIIQFASINNFALGRSITELLRIIDALIHVEQYGEVCPANWTPQSKAMKPTAAGVKEYFKHTEGTSTCA